MRPGGGKHKGGSFERKISKMISLWWSKGERDDLCWRSASSGARGTITKTKTKGYHGDFTAISDDIKPLFNRFCLEAKNYKEIDIMEIFKDNENIQIFDWWNQAVREAIQSKRQPLLIYRVNRYPEMLVCRQSLFSEIKRLELFKKRIRYMSLGNKIILCNLQNVFDTIKLDEFKEWLKGVQYGQME